MSTLSELYITMENLRKRELVLVVDYVPGTPLKVSLSRKRNLFDALEDVVEIKPDPVVEHTEKKKGERRLLPIRVLA